MREGGKLGWTIRQGSRSPSLIRGGNLASFVPERAMSPEEARQTREQQLREELVRAWARLRVAVVDDRVVGYLLSWHVVDEVHLLNVAVTADHRRQGLGEALVRSLIDDSVAGQAAKILLEVRASNAPAIMLYERLGFERFHVRSRYYADGEDGVEMMRRFRRSDARAAGSTMAHRVGARWSSEARK